MQAKLNNFLWIFYYLSLQNEKKIVLDFYNLLQKCKIEEIPEVLFDYCSEDLIWRGFHPFNEIKGIKNNDLFMMNVGAIDSWKSKLEGTMVQDILIEKGFNAQR